MPLVKIAFFACILLFATGCARFPLTEGGVAVDKNTTIGIKDLGVASVSKGF